MADQCPICLLDLGETNKMITQCGHMLCGSCFVSNLNYTIRCPICRENVVDIDTISTPSPAPRDFVSPISPSEVPTRNDIRSVYADLITRHVVNDEETLRLEVVNLLRAFEMDLRLVITDHNSSARPRVQSLSDMEYMPGEN